MFGHIITRSPYAPYSIYLRGTLGEIILVVLVAQTGMTFCDMKFVKPCQHTDASRMVIMIVSNMNDNVDVNNDSGVCWATGVLSV